jgi:hypothetical protein
MVPVGVSSLISLHSRRLALHTLGVHQHGHRDHQALDGLHQAEPILVESRCDVGHAKARRVYPHPTGAGQGVPPPRRARPVAGC